MDKDAKNKELLESLKESAKLYSDLSEKAANITDPSIDNKKLKNFAFFLASLIHTMGMNGYLSYLTALDVVLLRNLGPRIGIHRFSQFQLDTQPDEYFNYFKKIDNEQDKVHLIKNISDLRQHTINLQELLEEDPQGMTQTRSITVNEYQLEKYFLEYLDAIAHHYESFNLLSLYCLILIKTLKDYPTHDERRKLNEGQKDSVKNLYFGDQGLKILLDDLKFEEHLKHEIKEWFESIYGQESIRELRNLKSHHYGEERMKFKQGKLHVTYPNGTSRIFTLDQIKAIKINLQLSVLVGGYMVMHAFNEMLYQGFMKEFEKEDENTDI